MRKIKPSSCIFYNYTQGFNFWVEKKEIGLSNICGKSIEILKVWVDISPTPSKFRVFIPAILVEPEISSCRFE